ncbi:hypothetical protein M440DRAFT_1442881 [Trichoderma longibrachiatum ATCC 18648]|uniref:Uncharacterized protein n=1 Tax=Trichoderma longibrachiatum ATCC 18648 TaxID=983965 RepID=A0A2T4BPD2_TRILO|nr:hypothetical protein M440DRAFT_1442881 [Trichoderma longibrachiatum ATCC 18648]
MAIQRSAAEYFPPMSQPQDGNLSTSRRNNPQTLRRRQREDVSILRRNAIRRPSHARPVYIVINNIAIRTRTGRPQTPPALDGADELEPLEAQPAVVGLVESGTTADSPLAVQRRKLGIEVVAERPTTSESRPAHCTSSFRWYKHKDY